MSIKASATDSFLQIAPLTALLLSRTSVNFYPPFHICCPVCGTFDTRLLHIMLLSICEFMQIGAGKAALFLCMSMNGNPGAACPHTQHTTARTDSATYLTSKLENRAARLLDRRSCNCGNAETLCSLSTFPVYALSLLPPPQYISVFISNTLLPLYT